MSEGNLSQSAATAPGRPGGAPQNRPRLAIPTLRNIPSERPPARWRHWILGVDAVGRVTLPFEARRLTDQPGGIRAVSQHAALVLHGGDLGAEVRPDQRGRAVLPAWLRWLSQGTGSVLVAARWPDVTVVVVSPTDSLDELVDAAVGETG